MRATLTSAAVGLATILSAMPARAQHLNPMITLHEKGLPVFGISNPSLGGGRGGGGRGGAGRGGAAGGVTAAGAAGGAAGAAATAPPPPPPPPPSLAEVAKTTIDYKFADFLFAGAGGLPANFGDYTREITKAGGSAKTFAFMEKIPIWHNNPAGSAAAAAMELNAGHVGVMMQEVASAQEIRDAAQALRFKSAGGLRPDSGYEAAAAYWGLTPAQYKEKADVWPNNPKGELIIWAIVESKEGIAHIDEITAEKTATVVWAGYGTLNGVMRDEPGGRDSAAALILASCKRNHKPCGFPVNGIDDLKMRMEQGWSVFVFQSRNQAGMDAIVEGRKIGKRG